jgi:hypothetical protein
MSERTYAFKHIVKLMYKNNCSIRYIAERKQTTIEEIEQIIVESKKELFIEKPSTEILGSKTEPYYETEEEMLNPPIYKYEDLSKEEKLFYESRNNQ